MSTRNQQNTLQLTTIMKIVVRVLIPFEFKQARQLIVRSMQESLCVAVLMYGPNIVIYSGLKNFKHYSHPYLSTLGYQIELEEPFVGSTEACSKTFPLFFLFSEWIKFSHLRSRIKRGVLFIFSRHNRNNISDKLRKNYGAKKCLKEQVRSC